jgi:hypothetical protein
MADRCPRCHRPIQSDRDWMERTMPPGACRATGDAECEAARDERVRRMERVCCAAARVASDGGAVTDGCGCEWCDLLAALRALDGDPL